MKTEALDLKTRWSELLQKVPKLRIRDAARELGVSEAELLATRCGESVTRLEGNWGGLIKKFPTLGEVMCLTRNEAAVHERYGTFTEQISFFHEMGQVVGPDIDLRLFMTHWEFGFAVMDDMEEGPRRSLQFFDADGTAVFKVYLTRQSDVAAYDEFVQKYRATNQSPVQVWFCLERKRPLRSVPIQTSTSKDSARRGRQRRTRMNSSALLKKFGGCPATGVPARSARPGVARGVVRDAENARSRGVPQGPDHGFCRQSPAASKSTRGRSKISSVLAKCGSTSSMTDSISTSTRRL